MVLTILIIDDSFVERMIQLEQNFSKKFAIEHRSIFLWKIELSNFFHNNKNLQRSKAIRSELFKQLVNEKGFEDVKLGLCSFLSSLDEETLLKQINEDHLESLSSKFKYFSTRYLQYLMNRNFDESEKWLTKFEQECRKNDFSYYEPHLVLRKSWLLYWKSQFNEALVLLEELDEWKRVSIGEFYFFKSLLLLKLHKYNEAESVFNYRIDLDLLQYLSLSFIKFMKHDLPGAKELLESWKIDNDINNIFNYVCLYEMKWCDLKLELEHGLVLPFDLEINYQKLIFDYLNAFFNLQG